MRPSPEMIPVLIDTARTLKSSQRRLFMAKTVQAMGRGGQVWAEAHLGWNRETIRKGMHGLRTGMTCLDAFHCRRRKPAEEHLPRLLEDIRAIADARGKAALARIWDGTVQPLSGTEGAAFPFWSPDSRTVAFFAGGKLKKVDVAGGPVTTLADAFSVGRGAWSAGTISLR